MLSYKISGTKVNKGVIVLMKKPLKNQKKRNCLGYIDIRKVLIYKFANQI
jgi:hypothetical protein